MPFERELDQPVEQLRYGIPDASKSSAYTLVEVKPGIVFSSLISTSPSPVTKQSTRAIPSHSVETKACTASCCTRVVWSGVIRAGTTRFISPSSYLAS